MSLIPKKKSKDADEAFAGYDDEYAQLDDELDESETAAGITAQAPCEDESAPDPKEIPAVKPAEEPAAPAEAEPPEAEPEDRDDAPAQARENNAPAEGSDENDTNEKNKESADKADGIKIAAADDNNHGIEDDFDLGDDEYSDTKRGKNGRKRKKRKGLGRFITPAILLVIVIALIAGVLLNIKNCKENFAVNFYQIESNHVTSDIRIAVISDVHLSEYGEDNCDLVEAVRALEPDLIISAGDLVSYGEDNYDNMLSLCSQLVEIAPTYGIMGNHEDEKVYLENDEEMRQKFKDTGMITLINKTETITIRNNEIELVGVSGNAEGFDQYGGKKCMDKLRDSAALRICIAHVPTLFKERLEDYDFDIGIAGHTHGGVVRLPMIGGLYSAEEGFLPDFDGGLYDLDNGATLFVSRGLGNSGKIPRFNNTPELAVIDVRWY